MHDIVQTRTLKNNGTKGYSKAPLKPKYHVPAIAETKHLELILLRSTLESLLNMTIFISDIHI